MINATFTRPDLTTFARLDELGIDAVGMHLTPDRAVIECRLAEPDPWCHACGAEATARGTAARWLAHEPFGHRPTTLLLRVRRFRCEPCARFWQEDTRRVAEPRGKLTRTALGWALRALVVDHLTVSRVAADLDVAWHTANTAVLGEGRRLLIDDPERFDGVTVIGVDEHVWRHTRRGDKFVTVIIDLTPVREGTGPSRLLDMVEGRSKSVFKGWLAERPERWRAGIEVVAMDGFSGFKTAAAEEIPTAVAVMDPFHVVRLAGEALDTCRRRVQNDIFGRRGRKNDPLYKARRTLHTGASLLTDRQVARLETLFADEKHVEVEATHGIYQRMVTAYRQEDRKLGKFLMQSVIDTVADGVPASLVEVRKLGRTLAKRAADVLAYFDRPRTSNGPTEAINGRLEHLRGSALGFRNLSHYITRSLLEAGGFRPQLHAQLR